MQDETGKSGTMQEPASDGGKPLADGVPETFPNWQPIETAPETGLFWAQDSYGNLMRVQRLDHPACRNAVVYPRTGLWWQPRWWRPIEYQPGEVSPLPSFNAGRG